MLYHLRIWHWRELPSRIPPDQVIDAMREVGDQMHPSLRETGQGGLATRRQHASGARHRKKNKKKLLFSENFWYNKGKSAKEEVL